MSIVFTRVDSRGLHGQIVLKWMNEPKYKADGCIIVDNEIAGSEMLQTVYKGAAPADMKTAKGNPAVFMYSEEKALEQIPKALASEKRYFLLVRNPKVLTNLAKAGLDINFLKDLGLCMGPTLNEKGSKQLTGPWFYTKDEYQAMDDLEELGVPVRFQLVPLDTPIYWKDQRKKVESFYKE